MLVISQAANGIVLPVFLGAAPARWYSLNKEPCCRGGPSPLMSSQLKCLLFVPWQRSAALAEFKQNHS